MAKTLEYKPKDTSSSGGSTSPGSTEFKYTKENDPFRNSGGKFANDQDFWKSNIITSFLHFGYEPTETEVAQLIPTSAGEGGYERGQTAVANYVSAQKAATDRKANDPLKGFSEQQQGLSDTQRAESGDLFQKALDVYKSAPQLFGGLKPEQIQQYLAPVNEAAKTGVAGVEGAFGRRNLVGSSIEANALAEQGRLYQQNVLATGLQLGLEQQGQLANLLQGRSANLLGAAEGAQGRLGAAKGQLSGQSFDESRFLSTLPVYLQQLAMQERAIQEAQGSSGKAGFFGKLIGSALFGTDIGGPLGSAAGNAYEGDYRSASSSLDQLPSGRGLFSGGQGQGAPLLSNMKSLPIGAV